MDRMKKDRFLCYVRKKYDAALFFVGGKHGKEWEQNCLQAVGSIFLKTVDEIIPVNVLTNTSRA
jgi:hypothetical protein